MDYFSGEREQHDELLEQASLAGLMAGTIMCMADKGRNSSENSTS